MSCRSIAADAQPFAFQLFQSGYARACENCRIVINFNAGNQGKVKAAQPSLHDLTDAH
jgi:hypothetical protein